MLLLAAKTSCCSCESRQDAMKLLKFDAATGMFAKDSLCDAKENLTGPAGSSPPRTERERSDTSTKAWESLGCCKRGGPKGLLRFCFWKRTFVGPDPLQKCVGDFCCINFGGFCRGFSWRIFLGTFSHKNEEKISGKKIREKIRRPKNKNPRRIRSAKNQP